MIINNLFETNESNKKKKNTICLTGKENLYELYTVKTLSNFGSWIPKEEKVWSLIP